MLRNARNNSQAPDFGTGLLSRLQSPTPGHSNSQLAVFAQFVRGENGTSLADVHKFATALISALEDPACPKPSIGFEQRQRRDCLEKLRDIVQATDEAVVIFHLTGTFAPSAGAAGQLKLSNELVAAIPDVSTIMLRHRYSQMVRANELLTLAQQLTPLLDLARTIHVPSNNLETKRATHTPLIKAFQETYPEIEAKIKKLLPDIPDFAKLPGRLERRLDEIPKYLASGHLSQFIEAVGQLSRDLQDAHTAASNILTKQTDSAIQRHAPPERRR
jgi:hypothetical protein